MYKNTWAKPSIKQYFDQIYLERDIFTEQQKTEIEKLKSDLSSLKGFDTGISRSSSSHQHFL